jgi:hypothetical protein
LIRFCRPLSPRDPWSVVGVALMIRSLPPCACLGVGRGRRPSHAAVSKQPVGEIDPAGGQHDCDLSIFLVSGGRGCTIAETSGRGRVSLESCARGERWKMRPVGDVDDGGPWPLGSPTLLPFKPICTYAMGRGQWASKELVRPPSSGVSILLQNHASCGRADLLMMICTIRPRDRLRTWTQQPSPEERFDSHLEASKIPCLFRPNGETKHAGRHGHKSREGKKNPPRESPTNRQDYDKAAQPARETPQDFQDMHGASFDCALT